MSSLQSTSLSKIPRTKEESDLGNSQGGLSGRKSHSTQLVQLDEEHGRDWKQALRAVELLHRLLSCTPERAVRSCGGSSGSGIGLFICLFVF